MRRRFERAVHAGLRECGLAQASPSRLVVAVSGGADSTALLHALAALRSRSWPRLELVACYVDHQLRGQDEVAAERRRLRLQCEALGVRLREVSVDVVALRRERRLSWEDAARRCRYAALRELASSVDAMAVVTGHTADDQAETVLLRLLRGTGLRGLRAMAPVSRPWGDDRPVLARPLLRLRKADTVAYCKASAVDWAEDSSNRSARFLRNRVRAELLPLLDSLRPGSSVALVRLAEQAGSLDAWLRPRVEAALARLWREEGTVLRLARPDPPLDAFLAGMVLADALARVLGGAGAPSEGHVLAVQRIWLAGSGFADLPGGWQARGYRNGVIFERRGDGAEPVAPWIRDRWSLQLGELVIPGWRVTLSPVTPSRVGAGEPRVTDDRFRCYVRRDAGELLVGFWVPGERMRPSGMAQTKKLQDVFTDAKVPRAERRLVPLLYQGDECICAVGVRRSAAAPASPPPDVEAYEVSFQKVTREEESDPLV